MKTKSFTKCNCCGKPLSDPLSVKLGIGPICRINAKKDHSKNKQPDLFGGIAVYSWGTDGPVLWIKDLGTDHRSVTNDAENVLTEIAIELHPEKHLTDFLIMYKDSEGIWDELRIEKIGTTKELENAGLWLESRKLNGRPYGSSYVDFEFKWIGEESYEKAKIKLISNHKNNQK